MRTCTILQLDRLCLHDTKCCKCITCNSQPILMNKCSARRFIQNDLASVDKTKTPFIVVGGVGPVS